MEISKINIEFKEINENQINQHITADVVVIDRTVPGVEPMLYMLKKDHVICEEDFEMMKNGFETFDRNAFIQVGEVLTIDKKNKHIVLTNQNTLSYKQLVVAAGMKNSLLNYEFFAGIQTLIDALRVRKKIPSSFANTQPEEGKRSPHLSQKTNDIAPNKVESVSINLQQNNTDSNRDISLSGSTKRLYEVQI